jgi:hypothetical protein
MALVGGGLGVGSLAAQQRPRAARLSLRVERRSPHQLADSQAQRLSRRQDSGSTTVVELRFSARQMFEFNISHVNGYVGSLWFIAAGTRARL